ncbi:MAG: hypothetical protein K5979_00360 [Ruminococcus sp.]|nr:hypothetical protein [Ruminococcus sp.]
MKKRLISLLTASMMLTSAVSLPPVIAADEAVVDPILGPLPDWVPQDYNEAMDFYNTHGKSYVSDNIICLVRAVPQERQSDYTFSIDGSMLMINTPAGNSPKVYTVPDELYKDDSEQYVFEVALFHVLDELDLTVIWSEKKNESFQVTETFSFKNIDGKTVETDLYSWLPDSRPEYDAFLNKNGRASVHDNYIAYCADVNYSTGASLKVQQTGKGSVEKFKESDCNSFELLPNDGASSTSVILYKPVKDGKTEVTWTVGREWDYSDSGEKTYGVYNISDNSSVIEDFSPSREGSTVFTFVDKHTGELIDVPSDDEDFWLLRSTIQVPSTSDIYIINSNPCTISYINAYSTKCSYNCNMHYASGNYTDPVFEVTSETLDKVEVTCKLEWKPNGDLNGDGSFSVADAVTLENWILGMKNIKTADYNTADYCRDGKLDVFDICLMKKELVKNDPVVVEPDNKLLYENRFSIIGDDYNMYSGPGTDYPVIDKVMPGYSLFEAGYNNDNYDWVYADYKGKNGWIRMFCDDGSNNVAFYDLAVDKPVIYLYPEDETDVNVELELTESELSTTYPKYNNGWNVTAYPDGSLLNKADGTHHKYLFWDAVNCRTKFDFSKGFCVAGSDTESFLKEKLTYMGLTEEEMNEFIVYWLPRMEHNPYNLISFQGDAYTNSAKLDITPSPDSLCRVFMTYIPLENAVDIEPQQLETFERKGFTVVEWGGSEIKH